MFKKSLSVCFIAALVFGIFAGCANSSGGGKVVEDFTVTADYSQITVKCEPEDEDTKYFVYIGKNKDERPQESVWWGTMNGNAACRHVVEEPGRYYVWIQTEENGPISEPKAIDVEFLDPVTNVTVTTTLLGFKVSWTRPDDTEGIDLIKVGYKKAGGDWKYSSTNGLAAYENLNSVEDGTYTFKVLVCDKYDTKVSSEETSTYDFAFDTSYGQQPSCSQFDGTNTTIRDITDNSNTPEDSNADYYYINATKGERYTFDVLDYDSYELARISQGSWSSISSGDFITAKVSIYIAGACPLNGSEPDPLGLVQSKSFFKPNHELYFTCERDAYYVIKVEKTSRSLEGATDYGLTCRIYH